MIVDGDSVIGPAGSTLTKPEAGSFIRPTLKPVGPPPPPGAPLPFAAPLPPPSLGGAKGLRKDIQVSAKSAMKQLQWEKLNPGRVTNTIWANNEHDELEWVKRLQRDGIFDEMEEDFKARQLAKVAAARKKVDWVSVLDPKTRERIEILIRKNSSEDDLGKKIETIAYKILSYDDSLCNPTFLGELKPMLPDPATIGKLSQHRTDDADSLAKLHPADRFLVELIKIPHLAIRLEGMLYRATFEEVYSVLSHVSWLEFLIRL